MRKIVLAALQALMKRRHDRLRRAARIAIVQGTATPAQIRTYNTTWEHDPDFVIGEREDPYLYRWFVVPDQGRWPLGFLMKWWPKSELAKAIAHRFSMNIYFHKFIRSDDDRALHDHPWANVSWLLDGEYLEHVFETKPRGPAQGWEYEVPKTRIFFRPEGFIGYRSAETAHRVQLVADNSYPTIRSKNGQRPVWTLFITFRKTRGWGFWCPKGWRHWENFVENGRAALDDAQTQTGRGCE